MEKYSRVLVIIFFLCVANLMLTSYTIYKSGQSKEVKTASTSTPSPIASAVAKPSVSSKEPTENQIQNDLNIIKAEIRGLREVLGMTGSFEELSNIIKSNE